MAGEEGTRVRHGDIPGPVHIVLESCHGVPALSRVQASRPHLTKGPGSRDRWEECRRCSQEALFRKDKCSRTRANCRPLRRVGGNLSPALARRVPEAPYGRAHQRGRLQGLPLFIAEY